MLGLRRGDIDLLSDPGSLRVKRTLDAHREAVFNPPKTERSRRAVALHREAKAAFFSQKRMLGREKHPSGKGDLVFPSTTGTPMKADNLRKRYLKPHLAAAGLPELTLQELRYTFASIMLHEWHVPAAVVSEARGHADIAFTFRIYGHLIRRINVEQGRSEAGWRQPRNRCQTPRSAYLRVSLLSAREEVPGSSPGRSTHGIQRFAGTTLSTRRAHGLAPGPLCM